MTKELIICIIIVILIFGGNMITQSYTDSSVTETTNSLKELRDLIIIDDVNLEKTENKINDICDNWNKRQDILSFYIEHDELEKVKTELTVVKAFIEIEEFSDAVPELDKTIFILEHIQNKNILDLKNIF